jgi:hypothetical protein
MQRFIPANANMVVGKLPGAEMATDGREIWIVVSFCFTTVYNVAT